MTGDLICNKIDNKITNISKKSSKVHSENNEVNDESEIPEERYNVQKKGNKLLMI